MFNKVYVVLFTRYHMSLWENTLINNRFTIDNNNLLF